MGLLDDMQIDETKKSKKKEKAIPPNLYNMSKDHGLTDDQCSYIFKNID